MNFIALKMLTGDRAKYVGLMRAMCAQGYGVGIGNRQRKFMM